MFLEHPIVVCSTAAVPVRTSRQTVGRVIVQLGRGGARAPVDSPATARRL